MTRKVDDPGKLSAEEVDKVNKAYTAAVNKLLSHPNQTVTVPVNGKSAEYKAGDLAKRLANPVVDKKAVAGQDSTSDTVKISVPNNAQSLIQGHLTTDEGPEDSSNKEHPLGDNESLAKMGKPNAVVTPDGRVAIHEQDAGRLQTRMIRGIMSPSEAAHELRNLNAAQKILDAAAGKKP